MTLEVALQDHVQGAAGTERWVYLGEDTGWRISAERGMLADLERVPVGERVERQSWELRRPYIEWIGELSERNASLEWWASELAAKNPFTMLYGRICALACARELIAEGLEDTLVVCSTPALADAVMTAARAAGRPAARTRGPLRARARSAALRHRDAVRPLIDAWARHAPEPVLEASVRLAGGGTRALEDAPAYRRRVADAAGARRDGDFGGPDSVLLFTWADARSVADDGSYRDPHFGALPELLEGSGRRLAYVPRLLPGVPVRETLARLTATAERLFLPEIWLSGPDWRDALGRARAFRPEIPGDAALAEVPVAGLAREHVERLRWVQAWALAHAALVRNLARAGVRPERVILPFEGHAWEQVVTAAVHEHMPGAPVIGYDNVNFSRLALSLYPAASELGARPLPDVVVTNGPAFRETLVSEGFPEESVAVGCGLRHAYVWEAPKDPPARREGRPLRVLAATSIDPGQSVELIEKAVAAFGDPERYELTIKRHPALDREAVAARLSPRAAGARFVETPIAELLGSADVLLYTYSVVCYEALARGVPPVFVKAETFLDLDQLEPFPGLGWQARSVDELRAAAGEIAALATDELEAWRGRARAAVADALRPVAPDCAAPFLTPVPS